MKLENSFEVPVPAAEAWSILTDVQRVVPCVPGAELTEVIDDRTYKGAIKVRLGPVSMSFAGQASFEELDESSWTARMSASGREKRGRGGANADVRFVLEPSGDATKVVIVTDLRLSGQVAQYGRAAGMIANVSEEMVGAFADCLQRRILETPRTETEAVPRPSETGPGVSVLPLVLRALMRSIGQFIRRLFGGGAP